jgi:prevent-host-death family protein
MTRIVVTEISASQFKARCLALLDEVAEGGGELVVTKHGHPVAKLVSVDKGASLGGSVEFKVDDAALIAPIDSVWDAG